MSMQNPVVWFEIYIDDMSRAQKFYEEVFATRLEKLPMPEGAAGMEMLAFPTSMDSNNSAAGALVKMDGMKAGWNSTIVYFQSEDASIEEVRVEAAGGKILQSKLSIWEFGNMVLAMDTEGNTIGIHSMK